jgi:hypothetical protein
MKYVPSLVKLESKPLNILQSVPTTGTFALLRLRITPTGYEDVNEDYVPITTEPVRVDRRDRALISQV